MNIEVKHNNKSINVIRKCLKVSHRGLLYKVRDRGIESVCWYGSDPEERKTTRGLSRKSIIKTRSILNTIKG